MEKKTVNKLLKMQQKYAPVYFLAPAMILFSIFVIWPIFQSIWISFHKWDGFSPMTWVGLKNYRKLFDDPRFYTSLKNNIYWLVFMMLAPLVGLSLALFLNQQIKGMRVIKSLFFFPFVINLVVVGLVFSWFYNPDLGLLSVLLGVFGIEPIPILADEKMATFGIIIAGLWPQTAYCMILYLTGLAGVNTQIVEAGRIDGAAGWQMLRHVILPQLRPATIVALTVTVIGALRSFDLIATMTAGGPWGSSYVLAYHMYDEAIFNFKMGYGAALAVVLFLIMSVFIYFFLKRMIDTEK
ncbi:MULTISPECIES: carbohydrate ABC transporter permease [unclassified Oceanispirochaeta]|uniref:carbohydrate ABC transporter permease n=1 Tax=unclassified Oceanispirochaeta TaxID=2635722 RepID=UPI000E0911B8|nr:MULTISPECIES: sugar ABC transporter permease [unclassified Oceanispirochaeta]MBF9014094.1 sugar ABC transporter permease [Oceanispirochaeta sp. M2]NPD70585.1 sugar ABC transporter permease [Oceanispirochaeta sp. M1]RDG34350.1 sugar ABC transporter permease [Oceanispirochaeta sp. M1]